MRHIVQIFTIRFLVCVVGWIFLLSSSSMVMAVKEDPKSSSTSKFDANDHTDWGTYYDPKGVFCGKYDCYKILGFDYEEFGKQHPDRKEITQRYRTLSRAWHPDKSKHKDAKERFVKIARAYEVLTNEKTRKEYDFLRYNQEAYLHKYGSDVMWSYAPKSDTLFVLVFILTAGSAISWWAQRQKWNNVADKLIKAAVEDWGPQQGGTTESKELRDRAISMLQEKEKELTNGHENGDTDKASSSDGDSNKKKKKIKKLTPSERRKELEDSLRPIITELVHEIEDFGAGYHKPTWRDLMVVKLVYFPITFTNAIVWNLGYLIRRLRKIPLSDEEVEVLTRRAVGEVNWASRSEDEQKDMLTRNLWVAGNMITWEEEQELKLLRNSERKRYARLKRQGKLDKEE